MEVMTQIKPTETDPGGTRLSFAADRSLDEPEGDSVLRVTGERGGEPVIDTAYVEVGEPEARVLALVLEQVKTPGPPILDRISEAIQAQHDIAPTQAWAIAQTAARAWWDYFSTELGAEAKEKSTALTDRFRRAARAQDGR